MTDYFTLQTQIASIMDVLSKTAVAEICKLVDDGSVMLRLEMCRRENEIKELNRKLNLMEIELRMAREKNSAPVEIHVVNQLRAKESGPADSNAETTKTPPFQHQHSEEVCNFNRTITELSETQNIQPLPTASREGHTVPPEAGRSAEQLSGFQCVVKAERDEDHAAKRLHLAGSEQILETTGNLGSEGVMYESQLQTYFEDTDRDAENSDPSGSCDAEPYTLSVHAELQPIPHAVGGACYTLSLGQSHGQASSTVPVKEEFEMQTSCSEESRPEGAHTRQGLYDERLEREDLALQYRRQQTQHSGSVSTAASKLETRDMEGFAQSSKESERVWNHKNGTGMKRFICTHCGKSFDRFSHLERHQRIHTGEKPYSCATCGKCFSQKSSLKGHQRVHTGERPYSCNKCRKTFSSLSNRNAHQYHHTSVRAYSCYVCGKSYCHLSTLKVHQRIHTEGNLL